MPIFRILLLPFSWLYASVTDLRNLLYDLGIKKSTSFVPYIISVGNITAGGTGKTPFVELLIRMLKDRYKIAVLSRGYRRKTKGTRIAGPGEDASSIGDEPFQYYVKYGKEIMVAVGEKRALAILQMLENDNNIQVIILDDAFQHRSVKPDLSILLNNHSRPFYTDFVFPSGLLRESRYHARRADLTMVTKCPEGLGAKKKAEITKNIDKYTEPNTPIFFTGIKYLQPQRVFGSQQFSENVVLFSGIANADLLEDYVDRHYNLIDHKRFSDHYSFKKEDISALVTMFDEANYDVKCLLTTEKDMVRLLSMKDEAGVLKSYPVFYLPIELYFTENGDFFANYLNDHLNKKIKPLG